jgi:hypothetical protein
MKNYGLVLLTTLLISFLYSCTDSSNDKPIKDTVTVQTDTSNKNIEEDSVVIDETEVKIYPLSQEDKNILELLYAIDMNFSYMKVKEKYKALKGIRPEDKKDELANEGYTESVCKQNIFGGTSNVEFNFKNDSLYSYFFTYTDKDSDKAEQIFQAIKKHYSAKLGQAQLEKVEEENHYNQNYIWPSKKSVTPYLNFNLNNNTIVWGKRTDKAL